MRQQTTKQPELHHFQDDGRFPNSHLPLVIHLRAFDSQTPNLASAFEERFASNNWTNSWRAGVYDFAHYHSTTHEVLGVSAGDATLQLGGPLQGAAVDVAKGDVIVIPAGVAHQQLKASHDFEVVGAYPQGRDWDVLRGSPGERPAADHRIAALPVPTADPVYGVDGPLPECWRTA